MKKLIAVTGVILIAYVVFSASAGSVPNTGHSGADDAETAVVYTMRDENGRVVVYRNDDVYLTTNTRVSDLPKSDRVKLQNGITVFSEKELKRLVEDYCS